MGGGAGVEECPVGTTLPLDVPGWHRGPDLEWKTGHELNLIQKSPVMPTSARVPLRRTGIDALAKLN